MKLDPKALGIEIEPAKFRDLAMEALIAEGVDVVLWQQHSLPANPLFQKKEGYGKGCPWSCPFYNKEISYNLQDYPETNKLIENSFVVCSEPYPIYCQSLELMNYYVEGFRKVFENIEEVL